MASVYKSLSKATGQKEEEVPVNGVKKNKQRVLILSSRGITYRLVVLQASTLLCMRGTEGKITDQLDVMGQTSPSPQ